MMCQVGVFEDMYDKRISILGMFLLHGKTDLVITYSYENGDT